VTAGAGGVELHREVVEGAVAAAEGVLPVPGVPQMADRTVERRATANEGSPVLDP